MKHLRNCTALLLAAILAASVTSCGNSSTNASSNEPANTTPASSAAESTSSGDETEVSAAVGEVKMPLTEEKITLTMFVSMDGNASGIINGYNENEFFQHMEEITGVHFEFQQYATDIQTNFNLMIASNTLTDLIYQPTYYADGLEAGVQDGYFLDLTDLVPQYMPNYQARRTANDEIEKATKTDSGMLPCVYGIDQTPEGPWYGIQIRQDWLDDLGLDTPVTYDDWEVVLTAFKEKKNCLAPLYLAYGGYQMNYLWSGGFGVQADFQLDETGKVNYGPYMDGWKDYVTKMRDWYAKGLIDPDFMTVTSWIADTTYVINGDSGAWPSMSMQAALYESSAIDPNINVMPVASPVQKEGDKVHVRLRDTITASICTAISTQCQYPEIAMQWLDYLFTDEGALLANYGIEGDTFVYQEDGTPIYSDRILNNPDMAWGQAQAAYVCPPSSIATYYDWTRALGGFSEKDKTSYDIWAIADDDWMMPAALSLTASEASEQSSIIADVETFAKEYTAQFISGVRDIDAEWDSYISTMKGMGVERAIEIEQGAYDRYLQR